MDILSINFWLFFVYYIFAIFIAFYLPGSFFIYKLKLAKFQETVLSFILGMVLWAWQGMVFGYLNLRFLSYIYLATFFIYWIKEKRLNSFRLKKINYKKLDFTLILIILIGVVSQLTSVWFNGVLTQGSLFFCCGTWPDNVLNIAITNQVVIHFPPFEPGMYGRYIQNYHYWDSIVMGELVRVFKLPLIPTNYQYMTVFISLFLGLTGIVFAKTLNLGKIFTRWLVFLLYFGADLVWLMVLFLRGRQIFNMHPMESGQQFLENLPRAFSIVVLFAAFSLFLIWVKKKDLRFGVILSLVFSSLVGFKIYTGLLIFPGLGILTLYGIWKKQYKYLLLFLFTSILSAVIYLPVNAGAGGLFYSGTWRFDDFIVQGYFGKLNNLELARRVYIAHSSWLRVLEYELIYSALFFTATFGTKMLGLIQTKKSLSRFPKELHLLLIPGFIISLILGSFFLQRSGGSNTFNFLVSIFIVGSIYTALSLDYWTANRKKILAIIIVAIILIFTLPRGIDQAYENLVNIKEGNALKITKQELNGLAFLRGIKTGQLILVDPAFGADKLSPYVSFMTDKNMFLSGQWDELEAHNINFSDRLTSLNIILNSPYPSSVSAELRRYNVGYIYMPVDNSLYATDSSKFLKVIFKNDTVKILKVDLY